MRYAISDIHGCFKTFRRLIESGIKLEKNDQLFLMGDYIDRGPSSKQVLDYILYLMENNYNVVLLRGNHEEIFLNVIDGKHDVSLWYYNGGLETLHDFGFTKFIDRKELIDQFPDDYIQFIRSMKYYHLLNDYWLVHGGFNFSFVDPFMDKEAMVWARSINIDEKKLKNKKIIRGHTPEPVSQIIKEIKQPGRKIINIDAGCVYTYREGLGNLAAYNMDENSILYTENEDN